MEKNKKKLKGFVVSDRMEKSIVVEVSTKKTHPIYGKKIKWSTKYVTHDAENQCKIGDFVEIVETRPMSARKKFNLIKVIKKMEIEKSDSVS